MKDKHWSGRGRGTQEGKASGTLKRGVLYEAGDCGNTWRQEVKALAKKRV
jgi:hypothetical protein